MSHLALDHACRAKDSPVRLGAPSPHRTRCQDIDAEWAARLLAKCPREKHSQGERDLVDGLEEFGGAFALIVPGAEADLGKLLERGQLWGPTRRTMKGAPSQCHSNSCMLFEANQDKLIMATGYALSEDGLWRPHTWCLLPSARSTEVVETTESRLLYFGFAMDLDESIEFCQSNAIDGFALQEGTRGRFDLLEGKAAKPKKLRKSAP